MVQATPEGCPLTASGETRALSFQFATGFATQTLAYTLHSLVRVTRRVSEVLVVNIFATL